MSKTDKTNPSFVKAARGEGVTIDHDHRNGICDLKVQIWGGPRAEYRPRTVGELWAHRSWESCDIHVSAYSYPGKKHWPRESAASWMRKKAHRAHRRQANVALARHEEPEPLRTRHGVLWDLNW